MFRCEDTPVWDEPPDPVPNVAEPVATWTEDDGCSVCGTNGQWWEYGIDEESGLHTLNCGMPSFCPRCGVKIDIGNSEMHNNKYAYTI